jgi:hypothetical protein
MIRVSRDGKTIVHATKEIFDHLDARKDGKTTTLDSWNGIQFKKGAHYNETTESSKSPIDKMLQQITAA